MTSRASYELIQKCAVVRKRIAGSGLAPDWTCDSDGSGRGITLVGLVRGRSANVNTHPALLGIDIRSGAAGSEYFMEPLGSLVTEGGLSIGLNRGAGERYSVHRGICHEHGINGKGASE